MNGWQRMIPALALLLMVLAGCGGSGGSDSIGSALPDDNINGGTPVPPPSGGVDPPPVEPQQPEPGVLGELIDLGDLINPNGDNWYSTRAVAINDAGVIIGQSNKSSPAQGAFKWDESSGISFLGIHQNEAIATCIDPVPKSLIYSEAVDLNENDIIGNSTTGYEWPIEKPFEKRSFIFRNNNFINLHSLLGLFDNTYFASEAADINMNSEILLTATRIIPICTPRTEALYMDPNGLFRRLGWVNGSGISEVIYYDSEAVKINNFGQAVFNSSSGTAIFHDLDTVTDAIELLNHLPGADYTIAVDINDQQPTGHVIGNSGIGEYQSNFSQVNPKTYMAQTKSRGFFWDGGAMYPIMDLGGGTSMVTAINNLDQVVGSATLADNSFHAFLWILGEDKKGHIRDLGTLGGPNSHATAINEAGQVVGWSETGEFYSEQGVTVPIRHAFLWSDGVMYDLGSHDDFYAFPFIPPYPFSEAAAINGSGQTAGNSLTINAHSRGFTLTPVFP